MQSCSHALLIVAFLATSAVPIPSSGHLPPDDGEQVEALAAAAKDGDVEEITRLLSAGARVDAKSRAGVTALFTAALFGRAEAVERLVEKGARIDAAKDEQDSTALHAAAFFCHSETVRLLVGRGADVNARNRRGETPLDTVAAPWSEDLAGIYTGIAGAVGLRIDLPRLESTRPSIVGLLRTSGGRSSREIDAELLARVAAQGLRSAYYKDGEIHVNQLGTPEGKPLTRGHWDFKPSWSQTGDLLVFFRRLKDDPVVTNWLTAICVIGVDGSGFHQLTDGTHTDFNQTWTRDGENTPIWNRKNPERGSFHVMRSTVGSRPGEEVTLSDPSHHTWAYTCLRDGRILVQSAHPKQGWGYFLMTPDLDGEPRYERIDCELATKGLLDRVSVSPSEERVCFEYQKGFTYKDTGRTLYIADFDARERTITHPRAIANEAGRPGPWFAYPRWSLDETAVVYHANETGKGALFLYTLRDGSTVRVSTDPSADYRYPHFERVPK